MKQIYFVLALVGLTLFFSSCETEQKYEKEKLAKIYVDILIAEETSQGNQDSLDIYLQNIFSENNITKKEYEESIRGFKENMEEWKNFFELSESYLDSLRNEADDS